MDAWKVQEKNAFLQRLCQKFSSVPHALSFLPSSSAINILRNSGQIVSAMWPWQSQALEEIQSMDASRAEVRLALYLHLKKIIKHISE